MTFSQRSVSWKHLASVWRRRQTVSSAKMKIAFLCADQRISKRKQVFYVVRSVTR